MNSLMEDSKNFGKTTCSWWNYYRDKPNNSFADTYNIDLIANSPSFKYKSSIVGKVPNNDNNNNGNNNYT